MSTVEVSEVLISPEDYIRGELHSEVRHEYYAGRVEAMAGASTQHNQIAVNILVELGVHLRGKPCQPFASDMKVRIRAMSEDWFYYPDVMVNCDPTGQHQYFCETPSVIAEVLSEATEEKDRREKFLAYSLLPSLHTYILAAQDRREITVHRRVNGEWSRVILNGAAVLTIPELDFTVSLDAIYARTGL
jgi:Uma2 family endonuclease